MELDRYLVEWDAKTVDDFEVLNWWKLNCFRYLIFFAMAHVILVVPVSTIASKSVFCTGGCVLDAYQSSLTHKIAQAIIYTQDWIRRSSRPRDDNVKNNLRKFILMKGTTWCLSVLVMHVAKLITTLLQSLATIKVLSK
ncbi:hypothetical protein PTKIN_Ptkin08bG0088600 [Pterospermum kingtungense]